MTVKMPEPITAPMPNAVSEIGPRVFFKAFSGNSDSEISLSIDLVAKICLASALAPACEELVRGVSDYTMRFQKTSSPSKAATATKSVDLAEEISYRLLWPRAAFLTFCLFSPRAPVRGPFGAAAFRAARFTFLRSCVSVMLLVFAMYRANLSITAIFKALEALQLGKLLHQLLYAVLLKLYCNLRVIPISLATKHGSFTILRVSDPRTLLQPRLPRLFPDLKLWSRELLSSCRKEVCNIIH